MTADVPPEVFQEFVRIGRAGDGSLTLSREMAVEPGEETARCIERVSLIAWDCESPLRPGDEAMDGERRCRMKPFPGSERCWRHLGRDAVERDLAEHPDEIRH